MDVVIFPGEYGGRVHRIEWKSGRPRRRSCWYSEHEMLKDGKKQIRWITGGGNQADFAIRHEAAGGRSDSVCAGAKTAERDDCT